MNLLLVFSDTHGDIHAANEIILAYPQATHVLHLGDLAGDAIRLSQLHPKLVFEFVSGNCDWMASNNAPSEKRLTIGGKQIFMTHGHRYGVKEGMMRLAEIGKRHQDSLVLFGHTHMAYQQEENGVLLLNPGSISQPRDANPTFGLIEIGHGLMEARILEVP